MQVHFPKQPERLILWIIPYEVVYGMNSTVFKNQTVPSNTKCSSSPPSLDFETNERYRDMLKILRVQILANTNWIERYACIQAWTIASYNKEQVLAKKIFWKNGTLELTLLNLILERIIRIATRKLTKRIIDHVPQILQRLQTNQYALNIWKSSWDAIVDSGFLGCVRVQFRGERDIRTGEVSASTEQCANCYEKSLIATSEELTELKSKINAECAHLSTYSSASTLSKSSSSTFKRTECVTAGKWYCTGWWKNVSISLVPYIISFFNSITCHGHVYSVDTWCAPWVDSHSELH